MRAIVTDVACSVCVSVCLLVTTVIITKRLNRSICHLGHGLGRGLSGAHVPKQMDNLGENLPADCKYVRNIQCEPKLSLFGRRQQQCGLSQSVLQQRVSNITATSLS